MQLLIALSQKIFDRRWIIFLGFFFFLKRRGQQAHRESERAYTGDETGLIDEAHVNNFPDSRNRSVKC